MDVHIFVAVVGALLNMALSVVVPCLMRKSEQPFLVQVRRVFENNREVIITSSLIVALTIYLALKVAPEVQPMFSSLTGVRVGDSMMVSRVPLRNLVGLM
jgi:hypothetical protein